MRQSGFGNVLIGLSLAVISTIPAIGAERGGKPIERAARVVDRGAHHAKWERITEHVDSTTGRLVQRTNYYVQLATGLNYRDARGVWRESSEEIELELGAAVARKGQHKVRWAANINSYGAIEMTTPSGEIATSHVLGLAFYDPETGASTMIADIKDSIGGIDGNTVVYKDAFDGLVADIKYTYTRSGFEQDVVVREQLPDPVALGFDPETVQIQVLTEFLEKPSAMREITLFQETEGAASNIVRRAQAYRVDQTIDAGGMRMGYGRAFDVSDLQRERAFPVRKTFEQFQEGRSVLVETIDLKTIAPRLRSLPERSRDTAAVDTQRAIEEFVGHRRAPAPPDRQFAQVVSEAELNHSLALAVVDHVNRDEPGFVIDYVTLNSTQTDYTLRGDTTYLVSGTVATTGMLTIEGGTVVKFASGADIGINPQGTIDCKTSLYSPAIFTAEDDDTVGETISESSGTPSQFYGNPWAIQIDYTASDLEFVHFRHAKKAIYYNRYTDTPTTKNYEGHPHQIRHSQFTFCETAIHAETPKVTVQNCLFYASTNVFDTSSTTSTISVEHATVNSAGELNNSTSYLTLNVTNSLLVDIPNLVAGDYNDGGGNATETSAVGVFETVGGANHYLSPTSVHRNKGVDGISYLLLADFREMSTSAPYEIGSDLSYTYITDDTSWPSTVARGIGTPDIGYHYPVLDYVVTGVVVDGATLTLEPGVRVGYRYGNSIWGIQLLASSGLVSNGDALNRNAIVCYDTVQEQFDTTASNPAWHYSGSSFPSALVYTTASSPGPVDLTFTDISTIGVGEYSIYWGVGNYGGTLNLFGCEVSGGIVRTAGPTMNIKNCLFRGTAILYQGSLSSQFFNNSSMHRGYFTILSYSGSPTFQAEDNFFNSVDFFQYGSPTYNCNYNGYVLLNGTSTERLTPTGSNDPTPFTDTVSAPAWNEGPLGHYYLPSSSALNDAGSESNADAGLYHYTTSEDQTKEGDEPSTTVNIGYHYVAVVPAEEEVAKSGISATASSNGAGWLPSYAINNTVADPGWIGLTGANEWIEFDLGSSKPVTRFGYIPRAGTTQTPPYAGNGNGAIKDYEIYVYDSSSAMGNPVYSGEWNWPTGALRTDVKFPPKTGRYVRLKRINAFGWYGPYEPNQTPLYGYASVNEAWVYERNGLASVAIDTDGDTVPDYIEDTNGNGSVDTGEDSWNAYNSPNELSSPGLTVYTPLE